MKGVREITSPEQWDALVEASPQGSIFCQSKWLEMYPATPRFYGYFNNDSLLGGICGFGTSADSRKSAFFVSGIEPLIPFQGILTLAQGKYPSVMSMHNEIAESLRDFLVGSHETVSICNHYTFPDIRPFLWDGWKPQVKYTYTLDLTDMKAVWNGLEKQTRYEIRKSVTQPMQWSLSYFDELYGDTFKRKGMERPVSAEFLKRLNESFDCRIVGTSSSMAYVIWDNKRAYYILGASDGTGSAASVWVALEGLSGMGVKEIDMVGCNNREVGLFKRGFGGKLRPYFAVTI